MLFSCFCLSVALFVWFGLSVCLSVYALQVTVHEQSLPNFTHR